MLANWRPTPSTGQKPASSGYTRLHCGQLFNGRVLQPSCPAYAGVRPSGQFFSLGVLLVPRFAPRPPCSLAVRPLLSVVCRSAGRRRGGRIVDDPVARRALLEEGLAAQAVKELRRERHVA